MFLYKGAKIQLTKGKTQVIEVSGKLFSFEAKALSHGRLKDNLGSTEYDKLTPEVIGVLEHAINVRQRLLDIESSMSVVEEQSDGSVSYFPITVSR